MTGRDDTYARLMTALEQLQDNRCGICGRGTADDRRIVVDHDHHTGMVRGLLCHVCNTREGQHRGCDMPARNCPICRWRQMPAVSWIGWTIQYAPSDWALYPWAATEPRCAEEQRRQVAAINRMADRLEAGAAS